MRLKRIALIVLFAAAPACGQQYFDLQKAIDDAIITGGSVQLPKGERLVSKPAKVPPGAAIKIVGHGKASTLVPSPTFKGDIFLDLAGAGQGCVLQDFRVVALNRPDIKVGIRLGRIKPMDSSGLHQCRNVWSVGAFARACIEYDGSEAASLSGSTWDEARKRNVGCVAENTGDGCALLLTNASGGLQTFADYAGAYASRVGPAIKIHAVSATPISDVHLRDTNFTGGGVEIVHNAGQVDGILIDGARFETGRSDYCVTVAVASGLALGGLTIKHCTLEAKLGSAKATGALSQLSFGDQFKIVHDPALPTLDLDYLEWSPHIQAGSPFVLRAKSAAHVRVTVNAAGRVEIGGSTTLPATVEVVRN